MAQLVGVAGHELVDLARLAAGEPPHRGDVVGLAEAAAWSRGAERADRLLLAGLRGMTPPGVGASGPPARSG